MNGVQGFHKLVNIFREFNFEFVDFFSYKKATLPSIIFRHDIDFSLDDALTIASLEEKLGIKSTYFFMLTSLINFQPFLIALFKKIIQI